MKTPESYGITSFPSKLLIPQCLDAMSSPLSGFLLRSCVTPTAAISLLMKGHTASKDTFETIASVLEVKTRAFINYLF